MRARRVDSVRRQSVWWDDAPASLTRPGPPLEGERRCRVAVIGAGIAGASCADRLADTADGVLLLDAEHPGAGATGRNAGFLLAESDCFALTQDTSGLEAARALRSAGIVTRDLVRDLAEDADFGLMWTGSIRLAGDPGEASAFERSAAALDGAVTRTDPAHVVEAGAAGPFLGALADPRDGVVHPLRLLAALLDRAERNGVARFDRTPVLSVDRHADGLVLGTPQGSVIADHVVAANGPAVRRLLPGAARPIRPVRAQALVAHVDPIPAWFRPVYAHRGGDYWRLLPDGRVLLGGLRRLDLAAEDTDDERPSDAIQGALDGLLRRLVGADTRIVEVTHRWAGTMAFSPDHLPWVGRLPDRPGIHVLAGFTGHGMGWAPGLATELADALLDRGPGPSPTFRPRPTEPR